MAAKKFGLICEGPTDFHVLKHIIHAYFNDAEIRDIQPVLDARQLRTAEDEFGGWELVAGYLKTDQFEVTVENTDFIVVQIDTDVCEHSNFGVSPINLADTDHDGFYEKIKLKMIEWMDNYEAGTYDYYKDKIIFAISVHSLECWLFAYHAPKKNNKIQGCDTALQRHFQAKEGFTFHIEKKDVYQYIEHAKPFKDERNHKQISKRSESFKIFVDRLRLIAAKQRLIE